ncbi:MAG: hypothetical protein HZB26_11530 [Candidatus Hydrogenedentes bacterium]|nr:hypothetical protein [Candidatus Hydrogenedentota bacterium]
MNDQPLRERLFEQETRSPALEEKFRKELRAMTERKLKPFERVVWSFATALGLFFVVFFGYIAITAPHGFPLLARLGFVAGSVFGAAWAGLSIWTLRQGSINWLRHENAVHGITFGFVLILLILFQMLGGQMENKTGAILMVLNGAVAFMVFGIPALFNLRINRTEAVLREHLLKVELELAELADTMRKLK